MQCSAVHCSGGILLLGGGNLTRINFECCLVGGNEPLVREGGTKIWLGGGGMSKFLASGGGLPPSPPVGKTLLKKKHNILILKCILNTIRPIKQSAHHLGNFFLVFKK